MANIETEKFFLSIELIRLLLGVVSSSHRDHYLWLFVIQLKQMCFVIIQKARKHE